MNYLVIQRSHVHQGDETWVFRVNAGTQIDRDDQILYEYRALKLLDPLASRRDPFTWTIATSIWSTACC